MMKLLDLILINNSKWSKKNIITFFRRIVYPSPQTKFTPNFPVTEGVTNVSVLLFTS